MRSHAAQLACALILATPAGAHSQLARLDQRCTAGGGPALACRAASDMLDILGARSLRIAAGGNAVAGTASTIGRRAGMPRLALTARTTAGAIELPESSSPSTSSSATLIGFHGDLALGVLNGQSPTPTTAGLGSIDLLASAGVLMLPESHGFESNTVFTWAAGLRVGVLRESFTLPGIALSAVYRRAGEVRRGDEAVLGDPIHVRADRWSAWDASLVGGKRIAAFGVTAGAGYMRFSGTGSLRVRGGTGPVAFDEDDVAASRVHLFANLSWTALVWTLIGELGWQSGGGARGSGRSAASAASGGGPFGGIAARLTL